MSELRVADTCIPLALLAASDGDAQTGNASSRAERLVVPQHLLIQEQFRLGLLFSRGLEVPGWGVGAQPFQCNYTYTSGQQMASRSLSCPRQEEGLVAASKGQRSEELMNVTC